MFWSVLLDGAVRFQAGLCNLDSKHQLPACRQALAGGTTRSSLASKHSSPRSSLTPVEATQAAAALRPQVSLVTALAADKSAASGSKLDAYLDNLGLEPKMAAGLQSTTRSRLGPSPQPGQCAAQLPPRSSSVAGQRFSTGSESSSAAGQRFSSGSGAPLPALQRGQAASRLSYDGHQQPVTGGTAPHWSKSSMAAALLDTPPVQRVQYRCAVLSHLRPSNVHVSQACAGPAVFMPPHYPH